jgi:hypothetical protein
MLLLLSPDVGEDEIVEALGKLKGAAPLEGTAVRQARHRPYCGAARRSHAVDARTARYRINPLVAYPEGALALDALMITAETADKTG